MGILDEAGSIIRVEVPSNKAKEFVEHFPFRLGDMVLPSSGEHGSRYDYIFYIDHYAPHRDQLEYIITFPAKFKLRDMKFLWFTVSLEERLTEKASLFAARLIQRQEGGS